MNKDVQYQWFTVLRFVYMFKIDTKNKQMFKYKITGILTYQLLTDISIIKTKQIQINEMCLTKSYCQVGLFNWIT